MQPLNTQSKPKAPGGSVVSVQAWRGALLPKSPSIGGALVFALLYSSLGLLCEWYRPRGWDLPLAGLQTTFLQLCLVIMGFAWWPRLLLIALCVKVGAYFLGDMALTKEVLLTISDLVNAVGGGVDCPHAYCDLAWK